MQKLMSLSLEQTHKWLNHAMSDFWYKHQMPVTGKLLDDCLGYTLAFKKRTPYAWSDEAVGKLGRLIPEIERRAVIFSKRAYKRPAAIYVSEPPRIAPQIKKISTTWSLYATCLSCGDNQFLPIMMERAYVACYNCIHPSEYKALGGRLIDESIITTALLQYNYVARV
jgi:hypothetical protein